MGSRGSAVEWAAVTPTGQALVDFVEELGLVLDAAGLPRAAGRMLAWLMVCDPPEQSAEDLGNALEASTGGVSMTVRLLLQHGFVQRVGRPGVRKTYYRVAPGAWSTVMAAELANMTRLREAGEKGLALLGAHTPVRRQRLREMTDFYAFLERELPALMRRLHDERTGNHA